jgi:uncharacterized protein (DUF2384 family)
MKAVDSVIDLVVDLSPEPKQRNPYGQLVDISPHSVPWSAIGGFSRRLRVEPAVLLRMIAMSEHTSLRHRTEGYLKTEEADKLLRIGRIFEEAIRIFGDEERAAG